MSTGLLIAASIGTFLLLAMLSALVGQEASGSIPVLCKAIAKRLSRLLPPADRERYEKEWLADLAQFDQRPISMLLHTARARLREDGSCGRAQGDLRLHPREGLERLQR